MKQRPEFVGETRPWLAAFVLVKIGVGYEHNVAFFRTRRDADLALASRRAASRERGL